MRRLLTAIVLASSAACSTSVILDLPVGSDVGSVIVVTRSASDLRAFAVDGSAFPSLQSIAVSDQSLELTALLYSENLAALRLSAGRLERAPDGVFARRLPQPHTLLRTTTSSVDDDRRGWSTLAAFDAPLEHFAFEPLTLAHCAEIGGCAAREDDPPACRLPCRVSTSSAAPIPPESPALATLTPCPPGWRETPAGADALSYCAPPIFVDDCAVDEARFASADGCARVGTACPLGDWSDQLPAGRPVLYVHAGAPTGGIGTRDRPFGTIGEATRAAQPNTVIALSRGTFNEDVILPGGVALVGCSVRETSLRRGVDTSTHAATVRVSGSGAEIRNLAINDSHIGILVPRGASVSAVDLIVDGADYVGLRADGGSIAGSTIVARRAAMAGLWASGGASVDLESVVFEQNAQFGAVADTGSRLVLTDVAARETLRGSLAIGLYDRVESELRRVDIEQTEGCGFYLQGPATTATITDSVFRTTGTWTEGRCDTFMYMVDVRVAARRLYFAGNAPSDVVAGVHTRLSLQDVVFDRSGTATTGHTLLSAGTLEATRLWFRGTTRHLVVSEIGRAVVSDAIFHEPSPNCEVDLSGKGTLTLSRARLDDCVSHTGGVATLKDLAILRDVGTGLSAIFMFATSTTPPTLDAERVSISGTPHGIDLHGGTSTFRNVAMSHTDAGIGADSAAVVTISAAEIRGTHAYALSITNGAQAHISGFVATGDRSVAANAQSIGALVQRAKLDLEQFRLTDFAREALVIDADAAVDAAQGTISSNGTGASVLPAGYDLLRLMNRVDYLDNTEAIRVIGP